MLKPLLVVLVQRVGDPPPMLATVDMVKLVGSAAVAVGGLALIVWSLRPRRR